MVLQSAFFCAPLKTGALIVGWLQLTFVVLELMGLAAFLSDPNAVAKNFPQSVQDDFQQQVPAEFVQNVLTICITTLILDLIVLGLLIYGAYQSRPGFLVPYLAFFGAQIILLIFTLFFHLTGGLPQILLTGVAIYFLLVVASFYRQLRTGNQELKQVVMSTV